ncbi:DUF427 domain-containing protein [Rhodobacteraceae bacterium 2CG4]|uniref:DUF427 domain-containing protein n=1 Tax=Halovulum marinum TaxID=2662447 RepID=A0A6L5Z3J5_9RHOB|nr:DUF427 domain-containing protein [Halovulum marinum]MSU90554.1 DUF427 domain-containing protein [Halovulum marinum]
MTKTITIRPATGHWVIRAGGAVIGESLNALELIEDDSPPIIYFPREDVEMAFLDKTDSAADCPQRGAATFYSIIAKSGAIPDAAWSYEAPAGDTAPIAGHVAFHVRDGITVEQL